MGALVGHLMAFKNGERSEWLIPLLDILPNHRVLEIGFGPGVDVWRVSNREPGVLVAGVDHSAVMVAQARKRNASAIRQGRVDLRLGSVDDLDHPSGSFDRAFAVNNVQFWRDRRAAFAELRRVLKEDGMLAIAIQPRNAGATAVTTREWGERLESEMTAAGFRELRVDMKEMRPVPVVCVRGLVRA